MVTNNSINLKNSGLVSYDGAGTFNGRALIQPAAGITVSNGNGVVSNPTLALADDLLAVENLATTGLATRTAASTWTTRTLTAGSGVSISNGDGVAGNPTISAGATVPTTFTADAGSATPAGNNLNLLGSGSITTSGAGSTISTSLQGLTNHAVLVGAGTSTITKVGPTATAGQILQSAGAAADPAFSTATYPSTTTINQVLYSSANNVVSGLTAANQSVLTSTTTGVPAWVSMATDGKVLIGSTAGNPAAATLTAGTGVSISNGSNSITINASAATPLSFPTDSGTATPAANALTLAGSGSITTTGAGATVSTALQGLTNHNVLIGAGTSTITKVAPSATSGVPLISQGAAADPVFGTAVVEGGGTGNTTFTAYSVITAGTTATGAFQNVSGVGTSGQVLTSNGAAALPTWQAAGTGSAFTSVVIQQFIVGSPTYTPTSGMKYCIVEIVGGGGGGGGIVLAAAAQVTVAGGGGSGGYMRFFYSAAGIGASAAVTCGAAGTAGSSAGGTGGTGGTSQFIPSGTGSGMTASGGIGGTGGNTSAAINVKAGGAGGGTFTDPGAFFEIGNPGMMGFGSNASGFAVGGNGAASVFGGGGQGASVVTGTSFHGLNGTKGGGGGGSVAFNGAAQSGGIGGAGLCIVTEFI